MKRTINYAELDDVACNYVDCDLDKISLMRGEEYRKKGLFVYDMNKLLVRRGEGRYDWLGATPIRYVVLDNTNEYLVTPWRMVNVTINSLPLVGVEFMRLVLE